MIFGIDNISFYTPRYYMDLKTLAQARGINYTKFYHDLGQYKMSIAPPNEDVVTLAANAAAPILNNIDCSSIDMILFATETSNDLSKSAASYIHKLFNLPARCRIIELKQACYSATFGLQMGLAWCRQHPDKQVLLIASDIARYELNTQAESSHGCGACAMLLSADPKLLEIEPIAGYCTKETMDFWRPNYLDHALVDGRLSCETYINLAEETWLQYAGLSKRKFTDHSCFCYHTPVAKLAEITHKKLIKINGLQKIITKQQIDYQIGNFLLYSKQVGNCYSASLYLGIISLLENTPNLASKLIGLYSYGSGSSGEFFAARVISGYYNKLMQMRHKDSLNQRQELSFKEYEEFYNFKIKLNNNGCSIALQSWQTGSFYLSSITNQQRIYGKK